MSANWPMVAILVTLFIAWNGLLIGAIKLLFDRAIQANQHRFENLEKGLAHEEEKRESLEREFRSTVAEFPMLYVQREDWIRLATAMETKMDALNKKIDDMKDWFYARS